MNEWYLIVFLLTSKATDGLISRIVKKGYAVRPGIEKPGANEIVSDSGLASSVMVVIIQPPQKSQVKSFTEMLGELTLIVNTTKHFGYVLSSQAPGIGISNIKLSALPQKRKPEPRPAHLKLMPPGPLATFIETVEAGEIGKEEPE